MSAAEAREIMTVGRGNHFDRVVAETFLDGSDDFAAIVVR
jgi:response regulator RpfG family c-di-GMP phosphodiesterase